METKPIIKLNKIKMLLKTGQLSYDEAKVQSKQHFDELNSRMKKIADKYNKKHHQVSFINFMR